MSKIEVTFLVDCDYLKKGDIKKLPINLVNDLMKLGVVSKEIDIEEPKKRTRKTTKK